MRKVSQFKKNFLQAGGSACGLICGLIKDGTGTIIKKIQIDPATINLIAASRGHVNYKFWKVQPDYGKTRKKWGEFFIGMLAEVGFTDSIFLQHRRYRTGRYGLRHSEGNLRAIALQSSLILKQIPGPLKKNKIGTQRRFGFNQEFGWLTLKWILNTSTSTRTLSPKSTITIGEWMILLWMKYPAQWGKKALLAYLEVTGWRYTIDALIPL